MTSRKGALLAGAAILVLAATWYLRRPNDADFARYRFPIGKATSEMNELEALEKRTREMPGRALDLSDLALRYVSQARAQGNRSFYDKAEAAARLSLRLLPVSNGAAHVALAKVNEANHQFEVSIQEAKAALKDSPDSVGAWSVLVTSNLARGDVDEAAAAADRLVTLRSSTGHYALRALTLLGQNRREEAIYNFRRAFEVEEGGSRAESAWSRGLLGRHWLATGRLRESEAVLNEAARIAPESDFIQSLLADLYLKKSDGSAAEASARRALELSPQPRYLRQLAQVRTFRGDRKGAEGYLKEAEHSVREELAVSRQGHRLELVQILLEGGGKDKAEEAVRLAREETELRKSGEAYFWFAKAFSANEQWELATTALEASLRRGERLPDRYLLAAALQRRLKNPSLASLFDDLAR